MSLAIVWMLFGSVLVAIAYWLDLFSLKTAEAIVVGPIVLMLLFMMSYGFICAVSSQIALVAQILAWIRNRFDR